MPPQVPAARGTPSASVVVVAFDSLDELRRTLPPLVEQLAADDELIVVDNASGDGLAAELPKFAPSARRIPLERNLGFAGGANAGVAAARGDLVVLLNPDAVVAPGWLDAMRRPYAGEWDGWMGLVLLEDGERINTSGGVLHFTGFGWAGQLDEPTASAPAASSAVGFVSGACLAMSRVCWEHLGGFDPGFFMYCEDVDLSLRLRLIGGRLGVVPDARVCHDYAFAKGGYKWRWLERNRWATILRTYPSRLLALVMPALLTAELVVWLKAGREGWASMKARAALDVLAALPALWRQRREIQSARTISESEFARALTADLSSPYFGDLGSSPVIGGALRLYWAAVTRMLGSR